MWAHFKIWLLLTQSQKIKIKICLPLTEVLQWETARPAYIYSHTHGVPSSQPPILLFPCFFIIGKHTRQAGTASWQALIVLHICLCTEVMSDHTTICEISCLWKRPSGIAATNSRCVVSSSERIVWRVRVQRIWPLKRKLSLYLWAGTCFFKFS